MLQRFTHINTHIHTRTHIIYVHRQAYTHTYIHMYTYTYTRTRIHIWGVSRQLSQRAAREPQIVLFWTHVYDTKITLKNCLISVFDVFFPQLSNDIGTSFEIFHFHLQKLIRILFLAKNISGTLWKISFPT